MNLTIVENRLKECLGKPPEFVEHQIKTILKDIKEFNIKENNFDNNFEVVGRLDKYKKQYTILTLEYSDLAEHGTRDEKIKKLGQIIGTGGAINSYIAYLSSINAFRDLSTNRNDGNYSRDIESYKKSLSFDRTGYVEILKELKSEIEAEKTRSYLEFEKLKIS